MTGASARRSAAVTFGPARRVAATARHAATGASVLYGLALSGLAALWSFAPQVWWPVVISNLVAPYFFAPLIVIAPLALVSRSRWGVSVALVGALLFAVLFGDRFIPRVASAASEGQVRVATLNTWYHHPHLDRAVAAIRAQQADVVALQELSSTNAEQIVRDLGDAYPYWEVVRGKRLAIFSRYPIKASGTLPNLRVQWVILDVGGQDLGVVNVHIHRNRTETRRLPGVDWLPIPRGYNADAQRDQVALLLGELAQPPQPYILVGDFNTPDRDPTYRILDAELTDVYRAAATGFGFTYPSRRAIGPLELPFPVIRIDYIWTTSELAPRASWVDCTAGSDHCMVVADIVLPR